MSDEEQIACCIGGAAFAIIRIKHKRIKKKESEKNNFFIDERLTVMTILFLDLHDDDLFSNFTKMSSIDF